MRLFYTPEIADDDIELPQEEAGHCIRVLCMTQGDRIRLTDGKGYFYDAVITAVSGKRCLVHIEGRERQEPLWRISANCRCSGKVDGQERMVCREGGRDRWIRLHSLKQNIPNVTP